MSEVNTSILFTSSTGNQYYPLDPTELADAFDNEGDVTLNFIGKANGFKDRRGRNPGVGYILLRRSDIGDINLSATTHQLKFTVGEDTLTLEKLCIASALAVTGTTNQEANDVFLVELRDTRYIAPLAAINKSYNVPTIDLDSTTTYYTSTKNAGSNWTWTTLLQDIWALLPSAMSTLSLADANLPGEVPENYCFRGMRAWDAFCQVCEDSQNHIVRNQSGTYKLVARGFADTTNRSAISSANLSYRSLNPSWPKFGTGTVLPETFRVFFPSHNYAFQGSTDNNEQNFTDFWRNTPVYSVDVTTSTLTGMASATTISGTVGVIHSPRGAYYDNAGTILNSATLSTEATLLAQHAADQAVGEVRRQDIFHGIVNLTPAIAAAAVAWYDYGDGIRTELFTSPEDTPSLEGGSGSEDSPTDGLSIAAKDAAGPPDLSRWDLPFERFAVCRLQGALNPNSRVLAYVEYGDVPATTTINWANTALPHQVYVYEAFGVSHQSGEILYCAYFSQLHRWIAITSKPGEIVRFRLTATLSTGGSAAANILTWNGAGYDVGAAITVFDWHTSRGMWQGKSGMEGFAMRKEGTSASYDIVWMATYAWSLESTTTAALGGSSGSGAAATLTAAFEQGVSPGNVPLHDDQNFFPHSLSGAKVKGVRSEYEADNPYYKAINAQQQVLFGGAVLSGALCGGATATITGFVGWTFSPFNQDPNPLPTAADNPFGLAGCSGDRVFVVWGEPTSSWVIVQVTHRPQAIMQGLRVAGGYIQGLFQTFYVMDCCTGSQWINLIPLTTCDTPQYPPGQSTGVIPGNPPNSSTSTVRVIPGGPLHTTGSSSIVMGVP